MEDVFLWNTQALHQNSIPTIIQSINWFINKYVTGYDKSWLAYTHNSNIYFSSSLDSYLYILLIKEGTSAKNNPYCDLFLRLVRHPWVLGWSLNGSISPAQASCKSSHDWLVRLAMDSVALCDMWSWKWYQLMPLYCFQFWQRICPPLCGSPTPLLSTLITVLVVLVM